MSYQDRLIQTCRNIIAEQEGREAMLTMAKYLPKGLNKLEQTEWELSHEEAKTERMEKIMTEYDEDQIDMEDLPF